MARIASLENMLNISSSSLVSVASQLSEAEERERAFSNRGRWHQLRSMGDARSLLQYMLSSLSDARCQLYDNEIEIKYMKEQMKEFVLLLRQSEARKVEVEKELKIREKVVSMALTPSVSGNTQGSLKHSADDTSAPLSPIFVPAPKQLKYTPGVVNGSSTESTAFIESRKLVALGHISMKKLATAGGQAGKLWKWKISHHQWLLQFKWKWQKPWKLSEWIKHCDETAMKPRPHTRASTDMMPTTKCKGKPEIPIKFQFRRKMGVDM